MKLIQQIVLTVTWTELKSCNAASLAMLTAGIAVCPSREFVPPAEKERAVTKRDVLAGEYAEFYPKFVSQLVDLLSRVEAIDQECARIDGSAPSGEYRRLRGVELTARGLKNFSAANPSITKKLQLPDWANSDRTAWPPPRPSMAAEFAMSMMPPYNPRYSADWAAASEADNARRAANEARWAEQEAARLAENQRAYEASLRR